MPTKLSQLTNDRTFKTETEIIQLINSSKKLKKEVVTSLPSTGKEDIIYLLKNKNDTNNFYTEYLWIGNKWEIIGDTKVDLTDYAKKSDIKTKLSEMTSDSTHRTVSDTEKTTWDNKVDKINGKSLSTNDYTDAAKQKVDAIPPSPKYTDTVTTINGNTGVITKTDITALGIPGSDTTYNIATQSTSGLMSTSDKKKLDGIKPVTKQEIKDLGFPEHVVLTEAAYNALSSAQQSATDIFYYIKA